MPGTLKKHLKNNPELRKDTADIKMNESAVTSDIEMLPA